MIKDLVVVIAVKNRQEQLDCCISSIAQGSLVPRVYIVDFGSSPCIDYKRYKFVRVIRAKTNTNNFNKARALNIAIKSIKIIPFVCVTDADQIFQSNFIKTVWDNVLLENRFVFCKTYKLPNDISFYNISSNNYDQSNYSTLLQKAKEYSPRLIGDGCCHAMPVRWIQDTKGYDEKFNGWGPEDTDVRFRAHRCGLRFVDISQRTSMVHLYHLYSGNYYNKQQYRKNVEYYKYKKRNKILIGNKGNWGVV